ncbi:MAG: hypothetical protein WCT45_02870 [Candidatus Paceibacterota bacterium]|jgi:hypothetical protein
MTIHRIRRPSFLNKLIAEQAIQAAVKTAFATLPVKRQMLHVVVLAPQYSGDEHYPCNEPKPFILAELSFGDKTQWPHPFDEVARKKAQQRWYDRSDGGSVKPHLLLPGDTPFWGSAKRDELVAAASGVEPWGDLAVASMTIDLCLALSYYAFAAWKSQHEGDDFLPHPLA